MKKLLVATAILGVLITGFYFYFTRIGRTQPEVREIFITSDQVPPAFAGARIVHFSDPLIRDEDSVTALSETVEAINRLAPDIVTFTGNLFLEQGGRFAPEVLHILQGLSADIAKVAVFGYHDLASSISQERVQSVLTEAGFIMLDNNSREIFNQALKGLNFIGANPLSDRVTMEKLLSEHGREDRFNILLMSVPTFSALSLDHSVDLQLSGHCLGIQDASDDQAACFQFYDGLYRFGNDLFVNVSRGIARFSNLQGLTQRPRIDSFILLRE